MGNVHYSGIFDQNINSTQVCLTVYSFFSLIIMYACFKHLIDVSYFNIHGGTDLNSNHKKLILWIPSLLIV